MLGIAAVVLESRLDGLVPWRITDAMGTPGAHVVSWITGSSLQQESGLVCLVVGHVATIPAPPDDS